MQNGGFPGQKFDSHRLELVLMDREDVFAFGS